MRAMALDVGDRRIGVALSDPTGTLASAIEVIRRRAKARDIERIATVAREQGVDKIVVGLPRRLDGTIGTQAEKVQAFAKSLQRVVSCQVLFWDERLTTVAAERLMAEAGIKPARRRARIDAAAAAVILQDYLDNSAGRTGGGRETA